MVARAARAFLPGAKTSDALLDVLKKAFDKAASLGERTQARVLKAARSLEVPATRVESLASLPIETRDSIAARIAKSHASMAAVTCGAAGAVPVAGLALELIALAELNDVQVDHIARAYGFELGGPPKEVADKLPMHGSRALLLVPILAALEVKALERAGRMESIKDILAGGLERAEWQAIGGRLAAAAAIALLKQIASDAVGELIPIAGGAIAAWSSYAFTDAVGKEAVGYFRDLATNGIVVKGKLSE